MVNEKDKITEAPAAVTKEETKTTDPSVKEDAPQKTEDTVKSEKTPETPKEETEQVTFAAVEHTQEEKKEISNEGVVFAAVSEQDSVPDDLPEPIKRKFPVVPVAAVAAVLCIAASAAVIFFSNNNKNVVPAAADTSSVVSETDGTFSSESDDKEKKDMPVVIEQPLQISNIDTSSIIFGDNVTVEGISLSGKTLSQAFDAMQDKLKSLRERISINVTCDGQSVTLDQNDFQFDTDIASVLIQAYHYSRGELTYPNVQTSQNGDVTDFKVTSSLNKKSVGTAVKKAADAFDILPVNASVTKFDPTKVEKFTYADGKNGFMIDQKELSDKITDILNLPDKSASLSIQKKETPFSVTLPILKANTKLIASAYTTAANVWASNYNMGLAIKSASGTIVKPGETFSFNKMTGDTTNGALGYIPSTAIVKGEYVQSYGGGICQASTTLYLCALKADMEPVERWAHAYPSVYADRGLDATVDYGNLDMKFKNTKDYPIYIATYVYDYDYDGLNELLVEMYGPLSTEYDEIVPVGWISYAGYDGYYGKGAKVYFKNGKEIKREYTPGGSYDYKYDTYESALARIPANPDFGPANVQPTLKPPAVFSPNGCGSNAPIAYGTAEEYLKKAQAASSESVKPKEESSKQESSQQESSKQESAQQESSKQEPSKQESSKPQESSQQVVSSEPEPVSSQPAVSSEPEPVSSQQPESSQPEPVSSQQPESSQPEPVSSQQPESSQPEPVSSEPESSQPESSQHSDESPSAAESQESHPSD